VIFYEYFSIRVVKDIGDTKMEHHNENDYHDLSITAQMLRGREAQLEARVAKLESDRARLTKALDNLQWLLTDYPDAFHHPLAIAARQLVSEFDDE
jgi:ribosomal 50S subunit-associated protein YjgA (DUF615 family)